MSDALAAALQHLASRERLSSEMRAHLIAKGYEPDAVEEVVCYLTECKLLNDDKTTLSLIEKNSGKRSVGIEKLRAELEKRGAPAELIAAHTEAMSASETDRA